MTVSLPSLPDYDITLIIPPAFATQVEEAGLRRVAALTLLYEDRQRRRTQQDGEKVYSGPPLQPELALSVVITDDATITDLNRRYRGVESPTDVLAFPARESAEGAPFVASPESEGYLGDVIISLERAQAQAAEARHPILTELTLLIVHGVLHLLGYDHADEAGQREMWARQEAIIAWINDYEG